MVSGINVCAANALPRSVTRSWSTHFTERELFGPEGRQQHWFRTINQQYASWYHVRAMYRNDSVEQDIFVETRYAISISIRETEIFRAIPSRQMSFYCLVSSLGQYCCFLVSWLLEYPIESFVLRIKELMMHCTSLWLRIKNRTIPFNVEMNSLESKQNFSVFFGTQKLKRGGADNYFEKYHYRSNQQRNLQVYDSNINLDDVGVSGMSPNGKRY